MTPEIKKEYNAIKALTDMLIPTLLIIPQVVDLAEFENRARPFANGTLGIIALQFMGTLDLKATEENLTKAIEVSQILRKLTALLITEPPAREGEEPEPTLLLAGPAE